jgi:hypothetical protein
VICLEDSSDGSDSKEREGGGDIRERVLVLPGCGHVFHSVCGLQWLQVSRKCPTCRGEVVVVGV